MVTKNRKIVLVVLALAAVCLAVYFCWDSFGSKTEEVSYSEFYELMENNQISEVTITEKDLKFSLKNPAASADGSERAGGAASAEGSQNKKSKVYKTQNPNSPTLQETLLRNGVTVKVEDSAGDILSTVFDVIFYCIFAAIFIVVFRKFISPNTFKVQHKTGVKFDDVVGMENLKRDMKQVMDIMKNPAEYAKRGVRMPKGILLEGEPGNGKTLFAKALAGEAKINFIPAKATDFESMFMAIGPMKVKLLFKKARRKAPCIVFIDEFDGIGTVRNYSGSAIETENTRIVTALLNELDGFEKTDGVLVLAATNSIKALDPALIRPGRFDAKFTVPYPDTEARKMLVEKYTTGKKFDAECTQTLLAKMFDGFSCAKIESVLNRASLVAAQNGRESFSLDDVKTAIREN